MADDDAGVYGPSGAAVCQVHDRSGIEPAKRGDSTRFAGFGFLRAAVNWTRIVIDSHVPGRSRTTAVPRHGAICFYRSGCIQSSGLE